VSKPRHLSIERDLVPDDVQTTVVTVPIKASDDGRYAVKGGQLSLTIEYDGVQHVVSDSFSDVYGCDDTLEDAIRDYTAELYGHFGELIEREAILARGLRADLARLRSVIQILR
jgi:hypothetical protein